MKTTKEQNQINLINELSRDEQFTGLAKAIALMGFNGEEYEVEQDEEGDFYVYQLNDGERGDLVEPIEGDEERENYIVLTDEEADEKAKQYILDSVWAFNANFLAVETGIDQEVFEAIQANERCESNNDGYFKIN